MSLRKTAAISALAIPFLTACGSDKPDPVAEQMAKIQTSYTDITSSAPVDIRKDSRGYYQVGDQGLYASVFFLDQDANTRVLLNRPKQESDLSSQKITPLTVDFHRMEMDAKTMEFTAVAYTPDKKATLCKFDMMPGNPAAYVLKKCGP